MKKVLVLLCLAVVCGCTQYHSATDDVMEAQTDLVDVIGVFEPKIVKICGSNDRAED